jgi:hypothetical protein
MLSIDVSVEVGLGRQRQVTFWAVEGFWCQVQVVQVPLHVMSVLYDRGADQANEPGVTFLHVNPLLIIEATSWPSICNDAAYLLWEALVRNGAGKQQH